MWWLAVIPLAVLALIVMVAAMVVAILAAAGIAVPWLFFGFLLWVVLAFRRGPRQRLSSRHSWQPRPVATSRSYPSPASQPRPAVPPQARAQHRPELPLDVQARVDQIRRKVDVLLAYAPFFPPYSADLHIVRQTAADYLPRTVEAYLALPPAARGRVATETGKTALQELKDQLELLDAKLNGIAEDLERQDMDRLIANGRFLEERFKRSKA